MAYFFVRLRGSSSGAAFIRMSLYGWNGAAVDSPDSDNKKRCYAHVGNMHLCRQRFLLRYYINY